MIITVRLICNVDTSNILTISVFNLPQLYQKPDTQALLAVLKRLKLQPRSWKVSERDPGKENANTVLGDPRQITGYLTSIVASSLKWIQDDDLKEKVWEEASARLTERSGRTAMSAMDRSFEIRTTQRDEHVASILIHEPALTSDNLGLKTWAASYLLAQRLHTICLPNSFDRSEREVLELGAGTGLVGIAAAIAWKASVFLTDMSTIEPNLRRNVVANSATMARYGGSAVSGVLDWTKPERMEIFENAPEQIPKSFRLIVAADSIYSASQPAMLVETINHWLSPHKDARLVLEMPRRESYKAELQSLKEHLEKSGLVIVEETEEAGHDDWGHDTSDESSLVHCWYSMWTWRTAPRPNP
jgi:D-xylulose reductase